MIAGAVSGAVGSVANYVLGSALYGQEITLRGITAAAIGGFVSGVLVAVAIGLLVGALLALCPVTFGAGCLAAALIVGALMGAVAATVTYRYVTIALGGTPTQEGYGYSYGWGMVGGGLGAAKGYGFGVRSVAAEGKNAPEATRPGAGLRNSRTGAQVDYVVEYADAHGGRAPPGYVGGRVYENRGPAMIPDRPLGSYREYDVWPRVPGVGRGPERLVLGANREVYYTPDHYGERGFGFVRLR